MCTQQASLALPVRPTGIDPGASARKGDDVRILVIEDEARIANDIRESLNAAGYVSEVSRDGEDGWYIAAIANPSMPFLDLGLPVLDGITILKRWRSAGRAMPVIILTARDGWRRRSMASMPARTIT